MKMTRVLTRRLVGAMALLFAFGCVQRVHRRVATPDGPTTTVDSRAPYIKLHARDGALWVLSPWVADDSARRVTGTGSKYDASRVPLQQGEFIVSLDSVVLIETNVARTAPSVAALAVVNGISAGIAVACATNPKACFGSCPTFYASDGRRSLLQAEGFSASIAPSLEARDVDALVRAVPRNGELRIDLVNEAFETHVIRYADILVAPRPDGGRVFNDDAGNFWEATDLQAPARCSASEGDCRAVVSTFDEKERTSAADSSDLATREHVDLEFTTAPARPALTLTSRQSLLPTYLLYQAFAYLGSTVGKWIATLERTGAADARRGFGLVNALGGIDVLVPNAHGGWDSVATIRETGPLASDTRVIPLPDDRPVKRVRLRMAKGAWRIDAVHLASLGARVTPMRLAPSDVRAADGSAARDAHARLTGRTAPLVTFPGDRFTLVYRLPGSGAHEIFLESKGYYLEWMRDDWIVEENAARAASLFLDPAGSLRRLAPEFKRQEPALESAFWMSKYVAR
jgi:hypothetical protein